MAIHIDSGTIDLRPELHWLIQCDDSVADPAPSTPAGLLSDVELATWASFKVDKRRREWLLGRDTAKRLLAGLVEERSGIRLPLDQITVLSHDDGWPVVQLLPVGDHSHAHTLSISHSHGRAFCAAMVGENQLLGADLERIEPRSASFVEEYFTSLEQEFLAAVSEEHRAQLINAIWSGKEAALKAIRRGLAEDTRIVSCLPHPPMITPTGWLPMRITWDADRIDRPQPALIGRWRPLDGFVLTLATATEAA